MLSRGVFAIRLFERYTGIFSDYYVGHHSPPPPRSVEKEAVGGAALGGKSPRKLLGLGTRVVLTGARLIQIIAATPSKRKG